MTSHPSLAESLGEELDRYARDHDARPETQRIPCATLTLIGAFPCYAAAGLRIAIRDVEERMADAAAWKAMEAVEEKTREARTKRERLPRVDSLVACVRKTLHHYSGLDLGQDAMPQVARAFAEAAHEHAGAVRSSDKVTAATQANAKAPRELDRVIEMARPGRLQAKSATAHEELCRLVLRHWSEEKSYFESIPSPTPEQGTDMTF